MDGDLRTVKGIGPARIEQLHRLGVDSVEGLITHFPRDYQDRGRITEVAAVEQDETVSIRAKAVRMSLSRPTGRILVKAVLADDSGEIEAIWFGRPYMKNAFQPDKAYVFTGEAVRRAGRMQMISPDYELYTTNMPRILPVYHATAGLSQKMLRGIVKAALDAAEITDALDGSSAGVHIKEKYGLCPRAYAIRNIHFPESDEAFFRARRRLVFEELFAVQVRLMRMKGHARQRAAVTVAEADLSPVLRLLPYTPTPAQARVLDELMAELAGGYRMNRLVQGDVGSGKTLVALLTAYAVIQSGAQAALMAPTEVLAAQHYRSFGILEELGIHVTYLSGSQTRGERLRALEDIASGVARMVVGTHAVIQDSVVFRNLALVITDEQHRFGVRQREGLLRKGAPHVLVMTATPIPRSLALILYGDMDISVIDSLPPGRQAIQTVAVTSAYRERLYAFIRKQVDEGRQAYIICPAIESEELESVTALTARLTGEGHLPDVGMLHGQMRYDERQQIMSAFVAGEIKVLVATTVIEVGVNVPNATVMVVENAERFGLAQLHQLRGRVGRGAHQSWCVLITDSKSKLCRERMKALKESGDGFYISELDLKLRGSGDFFGTRQHGLPEFKIANLYQDLDILKEAQAAAAEFAEAVEAMDGWVVI